MKGASVRVWIRVLARVGERERRLETETRDKERRLMRLQWLRIEKNDNASIFCIVDILRRGTF